MYRGWLQLGGAEIANTSRLIDHNSPPVPETWEEALAQCACPARVDYIDYDDSWPGLREFLGQPPYVLPNAPWYRADIPQSQEFLGVWVTKLEGLGPVPVDRSISDAICAGGVAGPHRDQHRAVTVEAVLVGCTNPGVEYGLEWLACQLRAGKQLAGSTLEFLAAHPEDSTADPNLLRRIASRVVVTREPRVSTSFGTRGQQHRQGAVMTIEWEMAVLDPYLYGPPSGGVVSWSSTAVDPITWAHPPDCENPQSCTEIPILASVECVPNVIDVRPVQPPVCSGCIPVCEVETRVAQIPAAAGVVCRDQAVTVTVTAGTEPLSANFWFRPCGNTALCDRTGFLSLAGLPAGATVVADSVTGRAYGLVAGQQVRSVGIVHTPSGAPWTPVVLDSSQCWELVAQHAPGADYTVQISVRGRSA